MNVTDDVNWTLVAAAQRWRGTPFREHARVCQGGADCVQLVAALLEETGLTGHLELPADYVVDVGEHAGRSPLLAWFMARPEWAGTSDPAEVRPGDVLLFRLGHVAGHAGVALGRGRFVHCLRGHGVLFSDLADPTYARRFLCAFSPPRTPA
ncbi:MAG: C40 family peptidase [Armatimonadetes bacterium]|nr:C40 family peptidase [Armatimonadota bacterium]